MQRDETAIENWLFLWIDTLSAKVKPEIVELQLLRTLATPMNPRVWTPATTKHRIASTHGANFGVLAPTTAIMSLDAQQGGQGEHTGGGRHRNGTHCHTEREVGKQREVDASIDRRDCAATVVSRLHGGWWWSAEERTRAVFAVCQPLRTGVKGGALRAERRLLLRHGIVGSLFGDRCGVGRTCSCPTTTSTTSTLSLTQCFGRLPSFLCSQLPVPLHRLSSLRIVRPFSVRKVRWRRWTSGRTRTVVRGQMLSTPLWNWPTSFPLTGDSGDIIQVKSINVFPDPPKPGQNLTVRVEADVLERIEVCSLCPPQRTCAHSSYRKVPMPTWRWNLVSWRFSRRSSTSARRRKSYCSSHKPTCSDNCLVAITMPLFSAQ